MNDALLLSSKHRYTLWRLCAWAGWVSMLGSLIAWAWVGGFVPPPRADWTASQVYQFYAGGSTGVRAGTVLTICFVCLYWVWSVAIARLMRTIEGPGGVMSTVQLVGGISTAFIIIAAQIMWMTAAFRVESRTPAEMVLLNDMGWMFMDTTFMGTVLQNCAMAVIFMLDKRKVPLIPSWVCWLTLAVAVIDFSAGLIPFFYAGPFAWHGLISFWVVFPIFFAWMAPVTHYLLKAIRRLESEETHSSSLQ